MNWNPFKRFQKKETNNNDEPNLESMNRPLDSDPPIDSIELDSLKVFIDQFYYLIKDFVYNWSPSFSSFFETPDDQLSPSELEARMRQKRYQKLKNHLTSALLTRNSQIREQHKDDITFLNRKETVCKNWKTSAKNLLESKKVEAENKFFDPEDDYQNNPNWKFPRTNRPALEDELCNRLGCSESSSSSLAPFASFRNLIEAPSQTVIHSVPVQEQQKQNLKDQEIQKLKEQLKNVNVHYDQCLVAYQTKIQEAERENNILRFSDSQSASKFLTDSSDNGLPIIYHNPVKTNTIRNTEYSKYESKPDYQEQESEPGPNLADILKFVLTLPLQINSSLGLAYTRRNWLHNRMVDLVRLTLTIITTLVYLMVAGVMAMLIFHAVELAFLQLQRLREKRKKWAEQSQGQADRTFVSKELPKFESQEEYENYKAWRAEHTSQNPKFKDLIRKKESKKFWKETFGFLRNIIHLSRGGALVPLHEVDMYSVTEIDKQLILMTMSPECYIVKLERYRREMKSLVSELKDASSKKNKNWIDFRFPKPVLPIPQFSNEFLAVLLAISSVFGSNSVPLRSPNSFRSPIPRERIVAAAREQNLNQNRIETIEKQKEPLVANQHKPSEPKNVSTVTKKTKKWNRRIQTIQDLRVVEERDFNEEILEGETSSKLPGIKIKNH